MLERALSVIWSGIEDIVGAFMNWVDAHIVNILIILIAAWIARRFANKLISSVMRRAIRTDIYPNKTDRDKRIKTLDTLLSALMRVTIYIIAGILLIGEVSPVPVAAILASAGLIGVAIGFGAQSLVKDVVSGVFIIIENQYRIGDVVEISNVSGIVEDITIRTTVLRDMDGVRHYVPNGTITVASNKTIGYSNINLDITFDQDTDLKQLEHVINHVGEELAALPEFKHKIIETPHFLRVDGYGPAGLIVKVVGKTKAGSQWDVKGEFYKLLAHAFDKHKIKVS